MRPRKTIRRTRTSASPTVGASLIVVGNRGMHSGLRRFVLGSVPDKVSHHARCNVLIVAADRE